MKRRGCLVTVLVLAALVGAAWAIHPVWLTTMSDALDVGEAPVASDYVVILPGDENVRPFVAASLVRVGVAEKVIVLGEQRAPDVKDAVRLPSHVVTTRVLTQRGIPEDCIVLLGGASTSTFSDAERVAPFLAKEPDSVVTVVTTYYHTRRARWAFRRVMGDDARRLHFFSAPVERFDRTTWWESNGGITAIVAEYIKLVAYMVLYRDRVALVAAGCLAIVAVLLVIGAWRIRRRRRIGH